MSERTSMSGLWAIATYTWFDLKSVPPQQWLSMFLAPLLLVAVAGLGAGTVSASFSGLDEVDVVLIAPVERHEALEDWFADSSLHVRLVQEHTHELNAELEDGRVDLLATLRPDFLETGGVDVEVGPRAPVTADPARTRDSLHRWLVRHWATEAGGPPPELQLDVPVEDEPDEAGGDDSPEQVLVDELGGFLEQDGQHLLGWAAIGLLGVMMGVAVGVKLSQSGRQGFNQVLGLGTSRRVVYVSEMLTGATLMVVQALGWWLLYGLAVALLGMSSGAGLQGQADLVAGAPLIAVLAAVAIIQGCAVGCLFDRAAQDVPAHMRERLVGFAALPLMVVIPFVSDLGTSEMLGWASALPLIGPPALWSHYVEDGSWVAPLIGLQLVYGLLSIQLGSRIFLLDETPLEWVRRRLRR